ncbi:Flavin-dependent oxidoreductase, luciferase family (includes alkanesulfonate monooxygenase SsuD and methylene tetrahydromethanopterin reductase) [Actinacidiphila rubida]|uniref:Flavin-dependent oxidoreductase, luciferase family (Includes alkanesulfonate monooxygenase SsuD and methylene tetrahydromethanopterin reductase) n=1 Tax=Actinacidiphila rubida TaxID=310780 RepID=A0A1H8LZH2_9ACTN|nr:LLM class flavin-dependent oxidoreductase [Actinacidiphila rubida]SEO10481.1 Flavin-dependent oxidoreductase, luciferase family (includes alkanesulfonate monooxygenase SsuD and methylene tetrahydromethanopterin reductase) [Actinacidiphila rubida]
MPAEPQPSASPSSAAAPPAAAVPPAAGTSSVQVTVQPRQVPAPSRRPTRTLHLGAAVDRAGPRSGDACVELALLAERGALDFVTLAGGPANASGAPARVASATDRIGLLATAPAWPAPAATASEVAALDRASRGRAGWAVTAPGDAATAAEAALLAWQALRDTGSGAADCRPVLALDATEPADRAAVARLADIAFVRAARPEHAATARGELRALAARAGRDPDRLVVLADLAADLGGGELGPEPGVEAAPVADGTRGPLFRGGPVDLADLVAHWLGAGAVDGFRVRPVEPARDLERFVNGTVALLQHRGLFRTFHPGATLREHLGLHRPARATSWRGSPSSPDASPGRGDDALRDTYGRLG